MKFTGGLFILLLLTGCASQPQHYSQYLKQKNVFTYAPGNFSHCRGYNCRIIDENLSLTAKDWQQIKSLFTPPPATAETERQALAVAIELFEKKVGAMTGTSADIAGTYRKLGDTQHDCVDESVNTTIYLGLLEQKNLLRFHKPLMPQSRVFPFSRALGPHQSAVIQELATGDRYVVDSWFFDNGAPAAIAPLDEWFHGWRPSS